MPLLRIASTVGILALHHSGSFATQSDFCSNTCQYSTFADTINCLEEQLDTLDPSCSTAMLSLLGNVYNSCEDDIAELCVSGGSNSDPRMCLEENYQQLSADCQREYDSYLDQTPCSLESESLCPGIIQPHNVLDCLQSKLVSEKESFSQTCSAVVLGYSNCAVGGGSQPKPKPGPSKPPPSVAALQQTRTATRQEKPKPKPGPDDRPCWANTQGSDDPDSLTPAGSRHDLNQAPFDTASQKAPRAGLIASCVALACAVVGMTLFAYHRAAQDGGALPTVKGYWRAPAIQAAIFDDSYHPSTSKEVELENIQHTNSVVASPIFYENDGTSS